MIVAMSYPVHLSIRTADRYSRVSTFFRQILVIPHLFWLIGYEIAAVFVMIYAYFAILFTGTYPQGAFEWQVRFLRYYARMIAYWAWMTPRFPPFHGREDETYPWVALSVDYNPALSRGKTALRLPALILEILSRLGTLGSILALAPVVYAIPYYVLLLGLAILGFVITIPAWFALLFTTRYPAALFNLVELSYRYTVRTTAFIALVTDVYPFFQPESDHAGSATPPLDVIYCASCGTQLPSDAAFCSNCGAPTGR
jgi:hypothetical protein